MAAGSSVQVRGATSASQQLFARIGQFLADQRLEPDPANYAFAHAILAHPDGPLAQAVSALTDGGIRLTLRDIESLGAEVSTAPPSGPGRADGLVAQTQMQVEGFEDVVQGLQAETRDFGRDLAASAAAMRQTNVAGESVAIEQVARLTATMAERVAVVEGQLEHATREAAELREKLEEARDNARRDPLTNLPNRRAFEEAFVQKAKAGETLWLAVCDIDHFKSVNDSFGHAVGDRVLKAIGAALAETCEGHLVARYGGEEFVVLFSGIDAGTARATLERARTTVASKRYKLRETDAPLGSITFSGGLAPAQGCDTARTVFQRADALLYKAKADGRDCVRVA